MTRDAVLRDLTDEIRDKVVTEGMPACHLEDNRFALIDWEAQEFFIVTVTRAVLVPAEKNKDDELLAALDEINRD